MNTEWSKTTKYIVGIGVVLLGIYILFLSRSVIPLLVIAALIAVIVSPVIGWLHRGLRMPRVLAVVLVYLLLFIIVPLAFALVIPAIVNALQYVMNLNYENIIRGGLAWLDETLRTARAIQLPTDELDIYIDQMIDAILASLQNAEPTAIPSAPPLNAIVQSLSSAVSRTFSAAAGLIGDVFSTTVLIVFILLASIYFSSSARSYLDAMLRAVPDAFQPEINELMQRIERMWGSFFRGQITLMLMIGVIDWLGLTALGVPGAVSLGIIAGLLELIPNLGPVIATIPAVIVALLQGSTHLPLSPFWVAMLVLVFYWLVQQLENSLIVPHVLGEAVDLPPLVVMTGVLVGTTVAGILGALLATPIIGTLREVLRYVYYKMLGEDPFPPEEEPDPVELPGQKLLERLRAWKQRFFPARTSAPVPEADVDEDGLG